MLPELSQPCESTEVGAIPSRERSRWSDAQSSTLNLGQSWSSFVSFTGAEQERKSWSPQMPATTLQPMDIEWDPPKLTRISRSMGLRS
jgi:hypothetical protein